MKYTVGHRRKKAKLKFLIVEEEGQETKTIRELADNDPDLGCGNPSRVGPEFIGGFFYAENYGYERSGH